ANLPEGESCDHSAYRPLLYFSKLRLSFPPMDSSTRKRPLFSFGAGASCAMRDPLTFPRYEDELRLNSLESYFSSLEITPISAVDWQCNEPWSIQSRIVPDSMFFYIYEGCGEGTVEDKHFDLQAGDLMIMPKGAAHSTKQKKGHCFRLSSVHFHPLVFGGV